MGKLASSFLAPFFFFFLLPLLLAVAAVALALATLTDARDRLDFLALVSPCPCPCPGTDNEAIVTFLFFSTTTDAMLDRPLAAATAGERSAVAGVTTIPVEPLIVLIQLICFCRRCSNSRPVNWIWCDDQMVVVATIGGGFLAQSGSGGGSPSICHLDIVRSSAEPRRISSFLFYVFFLAFLQNFSFFFFSFYSFSLFFQVWTMIRWDYVTLTLAHTHTITGGRCWSRMLALSHDTHDTVAQHRPTDWHL